MAQAQRIEPAATQYWVIGGIYTDTRFAETAAEKREERFGPFESYKDAYDQWAKLAWRSVDDAHARYRIEATPAS